MFCETSILKKKNFLLFIAIFLCFFGNAQEHNYIVDSLNNKTKRYIYHDLDSAFYFAKKAIKESKKYNYLEGEMDAHFQLGRVYYDKGRRTLAMDAGINSLTIAEKLNNYEGLKNALSLIGKIQNHANQLEDGLKTVRRNYNLAKAEGDSIQMALMANFKGIFKNKMGEKDSAFYFTIQSLKINKKLKAQKALAYNYNSLGIRYYGIKNLDSTFYYLRKALKIRTQLNLPNQSIEAYHNIGYVFLMEKITDSAIVYFQKCIEICLKYDKKGNLGVVYKNISEAYEISGNYKNSYNYYTEYININDSIADVKTRIKIEKKQAELAAKTLIHEQELLEIENLAKKRSLNRKKLLIGILLLALFVLFVLTLNASNKKDIIKKITKKEMQQKKVELEKKLQKETIITTTKITEEHERIKEKIAKELHDGLGGTLASIRLNLSSMQKENDCPHLGEYVQEIEKVYQQTRIISHSLTPPSLKGGSFSNILEDYLLHQFENTKIKLNADLLPKKELNKLDEDIKLSTYRILQELCDNIIYHAKATEVNIHIIAHKEHLSLLIEDNGKGIENSSKLPSNKGLALCADRLKLIDGTMHIDSKKDKGTTIDIDIPSNKNTA